MPEQKRRKTARACNHCHRAHMTCDDGRPCRRCVQRGLGESCVDAPRKKKKYLMDVPDSLETPPPATPAVAVKKESPAEPLLQQQQQQQPPVRTIPATIEAFQYNGHHPPPQKQSRSKFLSSAANNEYSILSDILKQDDWYGNSDGNGNGNNHINSINNSDTTLSPPSLNNVRQQDHTNLRQDSTHSMYSRASDTPTPTATPTNYDIYNVHKQGNKIINQYMLGWIQDQMVTYPEVMKSIQGNASIEQQEQFRETAANPEHHPMNKPSLSFSIAINDNSDQSPFTSQAEGETPQWGLRYKEAEDIYAKVNRPFSYTPGFHDLIRYLRQRFDRNNLIQMAKSMASYRPSFIACTNTLKEEDLIFMEQCFQRTLLEYDKFISISGTPTIVWRRTGQIAYVSEEFLILTGWTRDQLLQKTTFIVELMDDHSVVEYFDLFSTIAYGDFKAATMGSCTLLTPDLTKLKTTCIWTLKRDVFGIPMMIIGNFLPIL